MKSKLLVFLAVVAALAAGFFLGRFQAGRAWSRYHNAFIMSEANRSTADFSHAAGLLQAIRSGDTNEAIETLEDDLDTHILLIGAVVEETPVAERERQQVSRIRWLRDYRAAHPRVTTNILDEHVAHVLTLVETNR